jgi:RNA polymerase sigma-70 factor (ECF subfamily)
LDDPSMPVFVWLRMITNQRLIDVHRRHLGAKMRDAGQEVSLHRHDVSGGTSMSMAVHLVGHLTSPSQAAIRAELETRLETALNEMDPIDREVLALRHFEELTNNEVAEVLGIQKAAASNRYVRALKRLREILAATPGFSQPGS